MCTVILLHRESEKFPVLVAANRDEDPNRPSAIPQIIEGDVLAPLDKVFGGSWLGVNRSGLLTAITNRHIGWPHVRGRRSRGLLVTETLRAASSVEEAVRHLIADVDSEDYNAFHLVLADREQAALAWSDGGPLTVQWLDPGLHVITGMGFERGHSIRDAIVRTRLRDLGRFPYLDEMQAILGLHGPGPEDGTCVHGPGVTHQSIFSAIVQLRASRLTSWKFSWRQGRPCRKNRWKAAPGWEGGKDE